MNKENRKKTLFFPNLKTVEKAINAKEFEKEIIQTEIEWDKIIDATIEALTHETVLIHRVCTSIVNRAVADCNNGNNDPKTFIELVENWEYIITELLSEGVILQVNEKSNDIPF